MRSSIVGVDARHFFRASVVVIPMMAWCIQHEVQEEVDFRCERHRRASHKLRKLSL